MSKQVTWYGQSDARALANGVAQGLDSFEVRDTEGNSVPQAVLISKITEAIEHYFGEMP